MQAYDDVLIRVHAEWNGWLNAEVRMDDLQDVRWIQPNHAPHPIVHADVSCSSLATGHLGHACDPQSVPHRVLVCVLKRHVMSEVYAELARRADGQARPANVPGGSQLSTPAPAIACRSAP